MIYNEFNPYRKRIVKKGIVDGSEYGMVKFVLPFFENFVLENYDGELEDSTKGTQQEYTKHHINDFYISEYSIKKIIKNIPEAIQIDGI